MRVLRGLAALIPAVLAVLVTGGLLVWVGGADPLAAYRQLIDGSVGSWAAVGESLIRFAPIAIIAAGLVPSLRAGLFNIGSPGQLGIGALAASLVTLGLANSPAYVVLPLAALAGALGGALWALIPGALRAHLAVNEILSTMALNFLALFFLSYLLGGPLQAENANIAQSEAFPSSGLLPNLIPGTRAHVGILLALALIVGLALYSHSTVGFRIRLHGESERTALLAGANARRIIIGTMILAGAAAGLAGWVQAAGVDGRLYATVVGPIGFAGFFVALLGNLGAVGILVAGVLFGAILRGGQSLQVGAGVSPELINAFLGLVLLVVVLRQPARKGPG